MGRATLGPAALFESAATLEAAAAMLMKVVVGVLAAPVLLAALLLQGATPSLQSPMLLADLCGVLAVVASVIALCSPDPRRKDDHQETTAISLSPAARPPRWPSM